MSFVNSLLQDITVLNRNDASKLEDWLTDIEATSDLTDKSRTKLAQAKSKGLIRTLNIRSLNLKQNLGGNQGFSLSKNLQIQTYTHLSVILWTYNKRRMNLWQLMYTALKNKLADANSIMMQPQLGYS